MGEQGCGTGALRTEMFKLRNQQTWLEWRVWWPYRADSSHRADTSGQVSVLGKTVSPEQARHSEEVRKAKLEAESGGLCMSGALYGNGCPGAPRGEREGRGPAKDTVRQRGQTPGGCDIMKVEEERPSRKNGANISSLHLLITITYRASVSSSAQWTILPSCAYSDVCTYECFHRIESLKGTSWTKMCCDIK